MVQNLLFIGAGAEARAVEKNTLSHSRSKMDRLRNTGQGICCFSHYKAQSGTSLIKVRCDFLKFIEKVKLC